MDRKVTLNLSRETAADFIDWLANDGYAGHTWHGEWERDDTVFVINGHELDTYSGQLNHLCIDGVYVPCMRSGCRVHEGQNVYSPIEYALKKLGF